MNTGQMLSVIGALVLLSYVSLAVKWMIIDKTTTMLEAEAQLNAISLAQSMIDEIQTQSFDASTVSSLVYDSTTFTPAGSLGPSSSESYAVPLPDTTNPIGLYAYKSTTGYNDVDDYNLYRRIASTPRMGKFTIVDTVYYAQESNPELKSSTQTFFKKIVVTVTHPNMARPLQLSDIAVYRTYY